jgi:polysaccharide biosynthesis transport protein
VHTVDRVIHVEEASSASFITAGAPVSDPTALLGSDRMKRLLEELSRRFELIVLDSPPVLSVSDARVLAQLADATVYLVRWGHTRRHDAMTGVRLLQDSGARLAGAVLTRVNARKHARYGYRDSGYFHDKRYTKYYSE